MVKPTLTIAIPTYNRATLLDKCLNSIFSQIDDNFKDNIEFIVSDNNSQDITFTIVNKYIDKGFDIKYYKNEENLGPDKNIASCFLKSSGKYVWLFSDDDFLIDGYLNNIIILLSNNDFGNIYVNGIWYKNEHKEKKTNSLKLDYTVFDNPNVFVEKVNYWSTFLTGNIVNKSLCNDDINYISSFYDTNLVQLSWNLPVIFKGQQNVIINSKVIACLSDNTGGYKLFKVFGTNYNNVLIKLIKSKLISPQTKLITKKHLLATFFPVHLKGIYSNFNNENPLKVLIPLYWAYPKFWILIYKVLIEQRLIHFFQKINYRIKLIYK